MDCIKRLLTNNNRFKPDHPKFRRVYLLNLILVSLIGVNLFYSAFNLVEGDIGKAAVNLTALAGGIIAFIYFHTTDNYKLSGYITVLLMSATLIAFFNVVLNRDYSFIWLAVFPPMVYFLLGQKSARIVTLIFGAYMVYFFYGHKNWGPAVFDYHALYNIGGAMISLLLLIGYWEISRREAAVALDREKQHIVYLNSFDSLTGFYNRSTFENLLKTIDIPSNLPLSVIFADINGLKLVNDVFGHDCGDALIKKCADAIKDNCRKGDVIARIGGDEFIILLPGTAYGEAKKIVDVIRGVAECERVKMISCSLALGCDTKYAENISIERVLRNAELEMYRQKSLYKKDFSFEIINMIMDTLHKRNPNEKGHSENVRELCIQIAKALGKQDTEIKRIGDAGYLHDIGKIVLDLNVLKKETAEMTEAEKFLKQQHTIAGYRILNLFDETMDLAEAVFSHHEYWDGTGYPKGLKGEEIPWYSRIISIAEVYDVLVRQMSESRALDEIKELKGKRFDPEITDVFLSLKLNNQIKLNIY
jgi:diguanylate cyclase (GGDEF)-like protein/putative nucleotidyltransferase with HDIG domain